MNNEIPPYVHGPDDRYWIFQKQLVEAEHQNKQLRTRLADVCIELSDKTDECKAWQVEAKDLQERLDIMTNVVRHLTREK